MAAQGAIILTEDLETALALSNEIAPEHLELLLEEPWSYLAQVKHAGAIFMGGPYTPEPVGGIIGLVLIMCCQQEEQHVMPGGFYR